MSRTPGTSKSADRNSASRHDSRELLVRLGAGDLQAAPEIFERYLERLVALVRARMAEKLRRRLDPEDVVQSAFRSFFVTAREGGFRAEQPGDLWRLLAGITLNKLRGQVEKHTAGKRNVLREQASVESVVAAAEPTPAEVVATIEQLRILEHSLTPAERAVLRGSLAGQSDAEIASTIGRSERTVRRLQTRLREELERRLRAGPATQEERQEAIDDRAAPLKYTDYVLEQLLGSGGMGKVYRALERSTGRVVAFKALHRSLRNDRFAVLRFRQEADILAELNHPDIVNVQGLGRFPAGGYFLVMDFIDGQDLQSGLRSGPISFDAAIALMIRIAGVVQHIHERGFVHGDLKPANVLLGSPDRVVLTDFGFAEVANRAPSHGIGGTLGYLAPEIIRGERPTFASDIFALGALLWVLCTGAPPGDSEPSNEPTLPRAIREICEKCLETSPANRFASAAQLVASLRSCDVRDR